MLSVPQECQSLPWVPDYLAPTYARILEELIPAFLRQTKRSYLIIGGRAVNVYASSPVVTADWDLTVFSKGPYSTQVREVSLFGEEMARYLREYGLNSQVSVRSTESPPDFVFRVSLVDPYLDQAFDLADLHNCRPSFSAKGNYCELVPTLYQGLAYAPKEFLLAELQAVLSKRQKVAQKSKKALQELAHMRESEIDEKWDQLEDLVDQDILPAVTSLREQVDTLIDYLKTKTDSQMLALQDEVKYQRTLDRLNALTGPRSL